MEIPSYKSVYSIKFPVKIFDLLEDVDEYELGKAFKMILIYGMNDNQLNYPRQQRFEFFNADPRVRSVFRIFKQIADPQIERYKKIVERNRKNGCKGGRPRKDGTSAHHDTSKNRYAKRELLEEILLDYGLCVKRQEAKPEEPAKNTPEIAPMQLPYYYQEYDTKSCSSYFDVVNL